MAKRAIDELDGELARGLVVTIDPGAARRALTELELIEQRDSALPPGLVELRGALRAAIEEARPPADEGV